MTETFASCALNASHASPPPAAFVARTCPSPPYRGVLPNRAAAHPRTGATLKVSIPPPSNLRATLDDTAVGVSMLS
ncbi:hypothetical protein K523DRAFT_320968 [Schizophyllum commune Tattone D]|nr:hypothetical protein K523DRAFT_320968 [Schizophyllum commune Tattone D]